MKWYNVIICWFQGRLSRCNECDELFGQSDHKEDICPMCACH